MNSDERDELEKAIEQFQRDDPGFDKIYRETTARLAAVEAMYLAMEIRKIKRNPLRLLARKVGLGCWCCGQWRKNMYGVALDKKVWCFPCKYDACPINKCNADLLDPAGDE